MLVRQKGNLVFTKWYDQQDVSILSTNCNPLDPPNVVERNTRGREVVLVEKPKAVVLYNAHMGGVDCLINFAPTSVLAGHLTSGTDTYFGLSSKWCLDMCLSLTKRRSFGWEEELCVHSVWHWHDS